MMKKNKFFSIVLCLALLVSMLPAAAFAAPANDYPFTIIFGTKAYDQMALAKPELAAEIKAAFIANSNKFFWVKADKTIIDNFGAAVDLATLPKNITLKKGDGTQTMINEGEESLQVISISAINATKIKAEFNKAVDPTKILKSNFSILDKDGLAGPRITILTLSADKKELTVEVDPLLPFTANKAPYVLNFSKSAFQMANHAVTIALPNAAPTVKSHAVKTNQQVEIEGSTELRTKPAGAALVISVLDLTDETNISTVAATTVVGSGKLTIDMTNVGFFKANHNYKAIIAPGTLEDAFGNKNREPVEYSFLVEENQAAPKMTAVEFFADKANAGQVAALVTFDLPVALVGANVNIDLIDKVAFKRETNAGLTAKVFGTPVAAHKPGLSLEKNQILILNVDSGGVVSMNSTQKYTLELPKDQVKETSLAAVKNAVTSAEADGVDVVKPTRVAAESVLVSAKEIKIVFSEEVTYEGTAVTVAGYTEEGAGQDIEATVEMSADKKAATLKPKNAAQFFKTDNATAQIKHGEGAFVDVAGNKITADGGTAIGGTDKAAPVAVKFADAGDTNTFTVQFTENIAVNDVTVKITVNGSIEFGNNAGPAEDKWSVAADKITVTDAGNCAVGLQVNIPEKAVKDAAGNVSGAEFGVTK